MNIFLISNMYPSSEKDYYGIFIKNIEKNLEEYGFSFNKKAVIAGRGKNKLEKIKKYIVFYLEIIKKSFKNDYDFIYSHYPTHSSIPLYISQLIFRRKLILHFHGCDAYESNKVFMFFTKKLLKTTSYVISPSIDFKNSFLDYFDFNIDRIITYPSGGINRDIFKPLEKLECRKKFNIYENEFVIGYLSTFEHGKGWDIFMNALNILKNEYNMNFKALIGGDGEFREDFLKKVDEYNLKNEVIYLGFQKHETLPEIYNSMDIFTFPTRYKEGLGLVGLEALSCGIPVIATNLGGIKDYITEGKNGFFFENENFKELAEKIKKFYYLPNNDKSKFIDNSLEVAKNYERKKVTKEFAEKLREINSN